MTKAAPQAAAHGSTHKTLIPMPVVYVVLGIMTLFFLIPMYMVVITAFKDPANINLATAWVPPTSPNWQGFAQAMQMFLPKFQNSLVLTISATLLSALLGSLNGYILAKWKFIGSDILFALMLFGMFIPYQSTLIPIFQTLKDLGLYGSIWGLILVHVIYGIPITTLIFKNYYSEVPDELMEAAKIDGAGFFQAYRNIILPISIPGFVVVIIWQFTQVWNEFLFAVTLTNPDSQPITVALAQLAGGEAVKWNLPMAGSLLAALPTLLVYIFLGKYFIRGLLAGSVKG